MRGRASSGRFVDELKSLSLQTPRVGAPKTVRSAWATSAIRDGRACRARPGSTADRPTRPGATGILGALPGRPPDRPTASRAWSGRAGIEAWLVGVVAVDDGTRMASTVSDVGRRRSRSTMRRCPEAMGPAPDLLGGWSGAPARAWTSTSGSTILAGVATRSGGFYRSEVGTPVRRRSAAKRA